MTIAGSRRDDLTNWAEWLPAVSATPDDRKSFGKRQTTVLQLYPVTLCLIKLHKNTGCVYLLNGYCDCVSVCYHSEVTAWVCVLSFWRWICVNKYDLVLVNTWVALIYLDYLCTLIGFQGSALKNWKVDQIDKQGKLGLWPAKQQKDWTINHEANKEGIETSRLSSAGYNLRRGWVASQLQDRIATCITLTLTLTVKLTRMLTLTQQLTLTQTHLNPNYSLSGHSSVT